MSLSMRCKGVYLRGLAIFGVAVLCVFPVHAQQSTVNDLDVLCAVPDDVKKPDGYDPVKKGCSLRDTLGSEQAREIDQLYWEFVWRQFELLTKNTRMPAWSSWRQLDTDVLMGCTNPDSRQLQPFMVPVWMQTPDQRPSASHVQIPQEDNPIWDQNGNKVLYEVRVNSAASNHLKNSQQDLLGDIGDQVKATCLSKVHNQTWSFYTGSKPGPIHLKLAWKRLAGSDKRKRFIIHPENHNYGLVAVHMTFKLNTTADFWLWTSFSHVDNVDGPAPLFNNPKCNEQDCPVNVCPAEVDGVRRTQIKRTKPLSDELIAFNKKYWNGLGKSSVLRNYQLLGVQRPFRAYEPQDRGQARPVIFSSEIIEWDRQETSCIGCHARSVVWSGVSEQVDGAKMCQWLTDSQCDYQISACSQSGSGRCMKRGAACADDAPVEIPVSRVWRSVAFPGTSGTITDLLPSGDMFWQYMEAGETESKMFDDNQ